MKKVLIFGAGSIGNHMSKACTDLGYDVYITDISQKALKRMRNFLYPLRYKKWNNKIKLINYSEVFNLKFYFNLIIIGTPPASHQNIFNICKRNFQFEKILIEKPISNFTNNKIYNLKKYENKFYIFCGYNHSVNPSLKYFFNKIKKYKKKIKTITINWNEGWQGILNAHPWLKNEFASYLGNYKLGGGAIQEHSHGLHALICIFKILDIKNIRVDKKTIFFKILNKIKYDYYSAFFSNIKNIFIKYETNLLTYPSDKSIKIETENESFQWYCNYSKDKDCIKIIKNNKEVKKIFKKTRSSEFVNEIKHVMKINNKKNYNNSHINLDNSLKVFNLMQKILKK